MLQATIQHHQKLFNILVILPIAIRADMNIIIITRQTKKEYRRLKMNWNTFFVIVGVSATAYPICNFLFWLDK